MRLLREELQLLQEPGSYVGEVVKVMGKNKVLVKVSDCVKVIYAFPEDVTIVYLTSIFRCILSVPSYLY